MGFFATKDGTPIFFKDWGQGRPVVFSHGWPLTADAWDAQLFFLGQRGYRAIAHDRRGHGRSGQPWDGNDMDTYADDLAALLERLDLRDVVLVGHSTGGGEVARYVARHGTARLAGTVLVSAVPPILAKTPANPDGVPIAVFDEIRTRLLADRSQYYRDLASPFFGANRPGAQVSPGLRDAFWLQCMQAGLKNAFDCVRAFSETDQTEDLQHFDVPTLFVHGDDDQVVPIAGAAARAVKLVKAARLLVYPGAPHGLPMVLADRFNADLLAFLEGDVAAARVAARPVYEPVS